MPTALIHLHYCYSYLVGQISLGLLVYSHVPGAIAALLLGAFLLYQARRLPNITLFFVLLFFAAWSFLDLGSWFAFLGAGTMMFTWTLADLFAPLFFFFGYYFLYSFLTERDLPLYQKLVGLGAIAPIAYWVALGQKLVLYDANTCEALERPLYNYYQFAVEGFFLLAVVVLAIILYRRAKSTMQKQKVALAASGVLIFLGFFLASTLGVNFLVSDAAVQFAYNFEIYGLFGMPIFLGYLGYLIVRYHAFNLKVFGAQALVLALIALIGAEFFFVTSLANRVLVGVTLVVTGWIGSLLIRGVGREIAQREHIEVLATELQETNTRQETLIHFIGHEVKGFLTKAEGAFAALAEGDFGALPPSLTPFVREALAQTREGVTSVSDILKASNQKKGTVEYKKEPFDLKALVIEAVAHARPSAEAKKLALTLHVNEAVAHVVVGDKEQFAEHVVRNLLDNSIAYTPSGSIDVTLEKNGGKCILSIKDTGVGISAEDKAHLFTEGGHGKESQKVNVHSTGYGLFIAKNVVEAEGGTIRAESEGPGKGSTFIVELPAESGTVVSTPG